MTDALASGTVLRPKAISRRWISSASSDDSAKLRSDAVHVTHLGFRPDDPAKVAFLSTWMGNGGGLKYKQGLVFRVINPRTGRVVFGRGSLGLFGMLRLFVLVLSTQLGRNDQQQCNQYPTHVRVLLSCVGR